MNAAVAVLLLLPGCLMNEALYLERLAALTDDDGDGYHEDAGDCDDDNPNVFPGAPELCNGFDDNCSGEIDELSADNDVAWYADPDGDGYAAESATGYPGCTSPGVGWVSAQGDCDDAAPDTYPGAVEACDGADNNCDGQVDEEPTVSPPTWHQDDDADGFGAVASAVEQCLPPASDWVADGTDCDDTAADVYPGAPERCDGVDQDCDSVADDPPVIDVGGWYADTDGDGYGDDAIAACVAGDGFVDVAGDCDDGDAGVNPGTPEVCNDGVDNNCDGGPGDCVWESEIDMTRELTISPLYEGETLGYTGLAADLDGDGIDEVVVGALLGYAEAEGANVGSIAVFRTPIVEDLTIDQADWTYWGEEHLGGFGSSMTAQDVDGDGQSDLQIGAGGRTVSGSVWAGTLYTLLGPISEGSGGTLASSADWIVEGGAYNDSVGERGYAFGDVDGDGAADYGTGYEFYTRGKTYQTGIVRLFTTVGTGTAAADDVVTATIYGHDENDEIGSDGTGLDLDGDGLNDLVVSAQGYDTDTSDGAALVFFGPVSGTLTGDDADAVFYAEGVGDYAGQSVANAGDVNADGLEDLMVGAPQAGEGSAYIVWGSSSIDTRSLGDADVTFRANELNKRFGAVVEAIDDLNEDGAPDVFISDGTTHDAWGYVYFGPFDATATHRAADADVTVVGDASDDVYTTAFTPGDATGDGVSDLVVGSYEHGVSDADGIVYILDGVGL